MLFVVVVTLVKGYCWQLMLCKVQAVTAACECVSSYLEQLLIAVKHEGACGLQHKQAQQPTPTAGGRRGGQDTIISKEKAVNPTQYHGMVMCFAVHAALSMLHVHVQQIWQLLGPGPAAAATQ